MIKAGLSPAHIGIILDRDYFSISSFPKEYPRVYERTLEFYFALLLHASSRAIYCRLFREFYAFLGIIER
jgi:hypothetical protein